jgi:hypothetical protein
MKEDIQEREEELIKELEEYRQERDRIRTMLGSIGGNKYSRIDTIMNILFLAIIAVLFIFEMTTHILPAYISLEIGVLLVSIKIVWMIHSQQKVYHFQFWILNTIEFRQNELIKRIDKMEHEILKGKD